MSRYCIPTTATNPLCKQGPGETLYEESNVEITFDLEAIGVIANIVCIKWLVAAYLNHTDFQMYW